MAPTREVRAAFGNHTLRIYQAFPPELARRALDAQTFVKPFIRTRMTWIKPSFMWMMYRSGWGHKQGQEGILAIDISRAGFDWALANSCLSSFDPSVHESVQAWKALLATTPVRIQWDPERTVSLEPRPWRTIQLGLAG